MNVAKSHWPALKLLANKRPLVIGHRGFSQFAPENTLASFGLAMAAAVDLVELDCHQSKDGVLLVIHDPFLDRTTDARHRWRRRRIRVHSHTAHEICSLDAGSWFGPSFRGAKVPLLAEALDFIVKASTPLIECKAVAAVDLVNLLREKHLINRVIVQSFDWAFLRTVHALAPEQILGALGPPRLLSNGRRPAALFRRLNLPRLRELENSGARLAVWNPKVSRPVVSLAHERGLKVWVYTVNTQRRANRLLRMGVDGLITDNPAVLWRTLALRQSHARR